MRALKLSTFGHFGISLVFRHFVRVSLPENGFSYEQVGQEINLAIPNYRALQLSLLFGSGHRSRNSRPSRFKRTEDGLTSIAHLSRVEDL